MVILFSCWACGNNLVFFLLYTCYVAIINCCPILVFFVSSLLVFIPNGDLDEDYVRVVRRASELRPIALSNSDVKIITGALDVPRSLVIYVVLWDITSVGHQVPRRD